MQRENKWQERFRKENFTSNSFCGCYDGDLYDHFEEGERKLLKFIQSEIDLAVKEERERIIKLLS